MLAVNTKKACLKHMRFKPISARTSIFFIRRLFVLRERAFKIVNEKNLKLKSGSNKDIKSKKCRVVIVWYFFHGYF